jgi:pSer/pThr/pTyr-binding forkhead associated (FHA) protein
MIERVVAVPFARGEAFIGRGQDATVELPFPAISARHARLFRDGGGYRVEDLGSANGTLLGGRRLVPHAAEAIAAGDVVDVGGVELRFEGELASDEHREGENDGASLAEEGTATLARRLVHDLFQACPPAECARLVVEAGPAVGRELVLFACGRVFKVGRGKQCDLAIPDDDVSREHVAFERGAEGILARDLGSKNGVEVGGQRVAGVRVLRDGESVCVGKTRLRVVDPEERYLRQMESGDAVTPPAPAAASAKPEETAPARGRLPLVAGAIAVTALLLALGLVLALAFAV